MAWVKGGVAHFAPGVAAEGVSAQPSRMDAPLPFALRTPISVAEAALRVRDLPAMERFYREALGLEVVARDAGGVVLGVRGTPILHLLDRPGARLEAPTEAGLFHIAFLMPTRLDLARWILHAAETRIPVGGAADHIVSEAIYLEDPEGNGIEVYSDRPESGWDWQDGKVAMGTLGLDVRAILAAMPPGTSGWTGAPAGLRIGHMHLRVGQVPVGRTFYDEALGLRATTGRDLHAAFLASGGYHHHVAINSWNSAGAGTRDTGTTGLDWFSLAVRDPTLFDAQLARLGDAATPIEGGVEASDPWGTRVRLMRA
ncbi:VOC family protein [Falsiroseomonas sp. HW251]|uniref:VOC family protein n=1 Tax=Falsiroseomonas sp. HW251 TaxID=3390998 RepID=UPI003D31EDAB